jgi:hypothetical protein
MAIATVIASARRNAGSVTISGSIQPVAPRLYVGLTSVDLAAAAATTTIQVFIERLEGVNWIPVAGATVNGGPLPGHQTRRGLGVDNIPQTTYRVRAVPSARLTFAVDAAEV